MYLPKPLALSIQQLSTNENSTANESELISGMLEKNSYVDDVSSISPQSRKKTSKVYPQCMSKAQQQALEKTLTSPRASRQEKEKPFSPSIVTFIPVDHKNSERSTQIAQRAIHMVSVYPVMRVAGTAFANALQKSEHLNRRSTYDRLEQSSLRLSRRSMSTNERIDNAEVAAATNINNLSFTNANLSDGNVTLSDSFNGDVSMLLDMSWTRLELMEDRTNTDAAAAAANRAWQVNTLNSTRSDTSGASAADNSASRNRYSIINKRNYNAEQQPVQGQTEESNRYQHRSPHGYQHHLSQHYALRQSVVQMAAALKRAMMWSTIIVNMLAHERMVTEFCALRLRRVLEIHMLPILLARKEETGSIISESVKAAHREKEAFFNSSQRREAQESLQGHYLKEHSTFLSSFNNSALLETLAETMERLRYVADEVIIHADSFDQYEMYFLVSGKVEVSEPFREKEKKEELEHYYEYEHGESKLPTKRTILTPIHGSSRLITAVNTNTITTATCTSDTHKQSVNVAMNSRYYMNKANTRKTKMRRPKKSVLLSGATFGGVFRTNTTYKATYKALTQCIIWKLTAVSFERALKMYADETMLNTYVNSLKEFNMHYLTTHLSVNMAIPRIPIYRLLDNAVANYATDFTPVVKVRGEVLFSENDPAGVIYCLIEGAVLRQTSGYDDSPLTSSSLRLPTDTNNNNNNNNNNHNNHNNHVESNMRKRENAKEKEEEEVRAGTGHQNTTLGSAPNGNSTSPHGVSQILTTSNIQADAGNGRFVLLGEEAHLLPCLQRHTCRVHSRVALFYAVRGEQFVNALLDHPALYVSLREKLTEQLRSSMKLHPSCLTMCPLFRHFPLSSLHSLCTSAEPRLLQRATAICEPVQHVKEIYFVVRGQVRDPRVAHRNIDPPLLFVNDEETLANTNQREEAMRKNHVKLSERHQLTHERSQPLTEVIPATGNKSNYIRKNNTINRTDCNTTINTTISNNNANNNNAHVTTSSINNINTTKMHNSSFKAEPWQHALLDADDNMSSRNSFGNEVDLSASASANRMRNMTIANNSNNNNKTNDNRNNNSKKDYNNNSYAMLHTDNKMANKTFSLSYSMTREANISKRNARREVGVIPSLTASKTLASERIGGKRVGRNTLTTSNTFKRSSNDTASTPQVVVPAESEELNPPLPRTWTKRFIYTIGGYWVGLLVEKWPYGFESTTTVELFAIPTLKIRTEFNACSKAVQNTILHDVREAQRAEMGWSSIKLNKLPPMEVYQPFASRSTNQMANMQLRNAASTADKTKSRKGSSSKLSYRYECNTNNTSRPISSRRMSCSPGAAQRSMITSHKYNLQDEFESTQTSSRANTNARCLSRSDELQSTVNEYDMPFTQLVEQSLRRLSGTKQKLHEPSESKNGRLKELDQQLAWKTGAWQNSAEINDTNWRRPGANTDSSDMNNTYLSNRATTKALHLQSKCIRNEGQADHARITHSTNQFGRSAKAEADVTKIASAIVAEYRGNAADKERQVYNYKERVLTKKALARYNGEPESVPEQIINHVVRDPVILPSLHSARNSDGYDRESVKRWTDTCALSDAWPQLLHASQQWFNGADEKNVFANEETVAEQHNHQQHHQEQHYHDDEHQEINPATKLISCNTLTTGKHQHNNSKAANDTYNYGQTLLSETLFFARENEKRKTKQGANLHHKVASKRQTSRKGVIQSVELPKRHAILH